MTDGPYRHVEVREPRSPRGIAFFGNDEGLSVEVNRTLPAVAAGAALIAATAAVALTGDWRNLLTEAAFVGAAGYRFWPRLWRTWRLTSIEIRGGVARFVQVGLFARDETMVPLDRLGLPSIGEIVIVRARLPDLRLRCLQFDDYVDGVRGGQSLRLQILVGYRLESLEWLCQNVTSWMRGFGGIAA